jgi:hypothetical protein
LRLQHLRQHRLSALFLLPLGLLLLFLCLRGHLCAGIALHGKL